MSSDSDPALTGSKPNILLIVLDSVRQDHLTPYGYDRSTTPELEALCQTATRYDQAIAAAPWTPPSHGAMFTGQYPSHCRVFGRQPELSTDQPILADELSAAGYNTYGYSNSHHTSPRHGFDYGFDQYHDILSLSRIAGQPFEPSLSFFKTTAMYLHREYDLSYFQLDRLKRAISQEAEPFFGFINLNSAHAPYDPPPAFKSRFEASFDLTNDVDESAARSVATQAGYEYMMGEIPMTDAEWELVESWYDAEIAYLDALLGDLFDSLRSRNLFDETMIIITSDHGEHFGEKGLAYHQFSLSDVLLNVPLMIKWPGQHEGNSSDELISLTDIPATCLDLSTGRVPKAMDGRSLYSDPEPDAVFAEYGRPYSGVLDNLVSAMFSGFDVETDSISERLAQYQDRIDRYDRGLQAVRTTDHKLVRSTDGTTCLFDVDDPENEITDDELSTALTQRLTQTLDRLPTGSHSEDLPDHVEQHLEQMGYL